MRIELADESQKPLLREMLAIYLVELRQYGDVDEEYPYFAAYWEPGEQRWPYLIREAAEVVGFALVNSHSPSGRGTDFSMGEFSILPEHRSRGLGQRAAEAVFKQHPGTWELSIMARNEPAQAFWPRALDTAGATEHGRFEHEGETIHRFVIAGGIWPM